MRGSLNSFKRTTGAQRRKSSAQGQHETFGTKGGQEFQQFCCPAAVKRRAQTKRDLQPFFSLAFFTSWGLVLEMGVENALWTRSLVPDTLYIECGMNSFLTLVPPY